MSTRELKASGQSGAGDLLNQAVDLLPAQLLGPLFRLASRSSVANMIMTNVPGPRVPVYLLGCRQLETYPVVPILANQALGIALMSYDDGLFWGFNADWDAVPISTNSWGTWRAGSRRCATPPWSTPAPGPGLAVPG